MKACLSWLRSCAAIAFVCRGPRRLVFVAGVLMCLAAVSARAQYTTFTSTHLGGVSGMSGTMYLQPVSGCSGGIGAARIGASNGQLSGLPYQATVTAGASSISIPDALQTSPGIAYAITVIDPTTGNIELGSGLQADNLHVTLGGPYGCVQPTGSSWNFDAYIPNAVTQFLPASLFDAPSATTGSPAAVTLTFNGSQYHLAFTIPQGATGPQGPPGTAAAAGTANQVQVNNGSNQMGAVPVTIDAAGNVVTPGTVLANGFYTASQQANSAGTPVIYDHFIHADGTALNGLATESGNSTWTISGAQASCATISGGTYLQSVGTGCGNESNANFYAFFPNTSTVGGTPQYTTNGVATFRMCAPTSGSLTPTLGVGTLIAENDGGLVDAVHLQFDSVSYHLTLKEGATFLTIADVNYNGGRLIDDCSTVYAVGMNVDVANHTVTVTGPDGQVNTWQGANSAAAGYVASLADLSTSGPVTPKYWALQEWPRPNGDYLNWKSIAVGGPSEAVAQAGQGWAAPAAVMGSLLGSAGNRTHHQIFALPAQTSPGAITNYKIADCSRTYGAGGGYPFNSTLNITANASYGMQVFELIAEENGTSAAGSVVLKQVRDSGGTLITGASLSNDGAGNCSLILTESQTASTYAVTLDVQAKGYLSLLTPPVSGAAALANASTLTLAADTAAGASTLAGGGSMGWYTVLQQKATWGTYRIGGELGVWATMGSSMQFIHLTVDASNTDCNATATSEGVGLLDQAQCSYDGANNIQMQFHSAQTGTVTLAVLPLSSTSSYSVVSAPTRAASAAPLAKATPAFSVAPSTGLPYTGTVYNAGSTIGWVTIATQATCGSSYCMRGAVTVQASSSGTGQSQQLNFLVDATTTAGSFNTQRATGGGIIDQYRVSGTTSGIQLDVHINIATSTSLIITLPTAATPQATAFVAAASPLATYTTAYTVVVGGPCPVNGSVAAGHMVVGDGSGNCGDGGAPAGSTISNIQITTGTTAIAANTCTADTATTMTGLLATSSIIPPTPTSSTDAVTGWGSSGGLSFDYYVAANTFHWSVCNTTGSSITPSASVTWNVGAR